LVTFESPLQIISSTNRNNYTREKISQDLNGRENIQRNNDEY